MTAPPRPLAGTLPYGDRTFLGALAFPFAGGGVGRRGCPPGELRLYCRMGAFLSHGLRKRVPGVAKPGAIGSWDS